MEDNQTLPPPPLPAETTPAKPPAPVLIIEDDRMLQEMYLDQFTRANFEVLQAFDGVQALEIARTRPDIKVMFVDIMLPRLSGFEVIREIRQTALIRDIPIVVVSALVSDDDYAKGMELGANEYITKGEMVMHDLIEKARLYAES